MKIEDPWCDLACVTAQTGGPPAPNLAHHSSGAALSLSLRADLSSSFLIIAIVV